jgi:hypothetical protein
VLIINVSVWEYLREDSCGLECRVQVQLERRSCFESHGLAERGVWMRRNVLHVL